MAKSYYRHPGTAIKQVLACWGITERSGCGCTDLANEMDRDGPDRVEQRLEDYYIPKMNDSIKKWRGKIKVPTFQPPEIAIRKLIQYGISKAREVPNP